MDKLMAWRSKDGTNIKLSTGVRIWGYCDATDVQPEWVIAIGDSEFGTYETESQMHFCLDQLWEDIGYGGFARTDFNDDIYVKPVEEELNITIPARTFKLENLGESADD